MVSDSPETIKPPLEVLNASDWAQKAHIEIQSIKVSWNGATRVWNLAIANGVGPQNIRVSTAILESPSKLQTTLRNHFLKPILLPKSKDMWVAYWLSYIMEAAEETPKGAGIDSRIQDLLGDSGYFAIFSSATNAATHFAEQGLSSSAINDKIIFGAHLPHRTLLRAPIVIRVYQDIFGNRPIEDDVYAVLLREGYSPGSPTKCTYTRNESRHQTSIRFWWKATVSDAPTT